MKAVPTTTATGLGPLPELLEARESRKALRRVFAAHGVPLAVLERRDLRLPLATLTGLFHAAAAEAGSARFGLDVGVAMAPGEFGLWVRYAMQAPDLGEAIRRIARTLPLHQSGTAMRLAPRPDGLAAWEYRCPGAADPASGQHSDHILPVMIGIARVYLGPGWTPPRVEVAYPAPRHAATLEAATGAAWAFGRPCLALLLPTGALRAGPGPADPARTGFAGGRRHGPLLSQADVVAAARRAAANDAGHDAVADIADVVALRLLDGRSELDGAACLLGLGRRTIQRRLAERGLTYRALVTHVRMRRARSLIEDTDLALKRIGSELGYTDPAHFSRAFARHFGFPPSQLRAAGSAP